MPKIHADGSISDATQAAPVVEPGQAVEVEPADEPDEPAAERPSPRERKRTRRDATAHAGHATADGGAGELG